MALEELYRDIVESSTDGIWVIDLDGRTLYANPTLATMFGVTQEEMRRLTVFDSLDQPGKEQFALHLEDLRAGRFNEADVECRFVRQDGTQIWVLVSERGIYDESGRLRGVLHRLADYTGRRRTMDDLAASRRALAEAQRIARLGSWEWDLESDQITGSEALSALYGLSPDSFPVSYSEFLETVHEEDRATVHDAVETARRDGGEFVFVARVRGADGWVWTRGRGVAQEDETGRVVSMSGTHQDITETKLAEIALQDHLSQNTLLQAIASAANEARTLHDVLVHARHMVLLHDDWERGRAFLVVDGAVAPLYVTEEDRKEDEVTTEVNAAERELAQRALERRAAVWDDARLTIAFPIKFQSEVFAVITITSAPPLYRHALIESMVEQVSAQLSQVIERQQNEKALADARDGAMEASRQKSEFLATMSHEIRTPLNGVIGLNDLLLRTRLDADQQRLASGVQASSRALLGLINDILDFSKIEAGKLHLEVVDFEVRRVLDQVTDVVGEAARTKGLELIVQCDSSVPQTLSGDPTRLAQVITNLSSNAVKFTESGEVLIRVTAAEPHHAPDETPDEAPDEEQDHVVLRVEVTDTGIGIRESQVDDLFEMFTQADTSTTRVHGGTGLGLAISREIVHALGGGIGVDSVPGKGSVFWFTATFDHPLIDVASSDDDTARTWLAGRRVLIVDDNAHHRTAVCKQCTWWRMRGTCVGSADEAEQVLEDAIADGDPFEAVLIDRTLSLPRRDGVQFAELLRTRRDLDEVTLMLMTPTTDLDTATARDSGIAGVLVKPISHHHLRAALLEHVAGLGPPAAADERVGRTTGKRRRILVVEDNKVNQMVAVGLLRALGYDTDTADDGQAALDIFDPLVHDAVLMDVQMPRLDGYATTRAIRTRETDRRVLVMAMTAAAVEGERERCLAAGMDEFLTKPVDPDALSATLARWFAGTPASTHLASGVETSPATQQGVLDEDRLDMLRDMSPGDTSYLDGAIANFLSGTRGSLDVIRAACAADRAEELRQTAHKLAGSALNLGVTDVGETARAIERLADAGSCDGVADLLPTLERAVAEGCAALSAYRSAYATGVETAHARVRVARGGSCDTEEGR